MKKEELKKHCLKQVEYCEMWARHTGEEPHGKIYEEHKLILELLEQDSIIDKIRSEIDLETRVQVKHYTNTNAVIDAVLDVIDEYKTESGEEE